MAMAISFAGLRRAIGVFLSYDHPLKHASFTVSPSFFSRLPPCLPSSTCRLQSTNSGVAPPNPPESGYNPPETTPPDPQIMADHWRYALSLYSRYSAQAWGTAILAGVSFFSLGWFIKGSNPLSAKKSAEEDDGQQLS